MLDHSFDLFAYLKSYRTVQEFARREKSLIVENT